MITLKNVVKTYNHKNVVDGISFTIEKGELFGFLGPNGAGKTTTIKMITGILDADEGKILIDGYDVDKQPMEAKRQFGFVPDSPDIFLSLKAIEYLNFLCDIYDVEDRENKIVSLTKKFEIYDVLNNKLESFSHGMRQKIILIGALLHNPNNWILDEPMTGLDPKSSFDLKEMMREHADEGKTVFFSTHVLEVAEKMCDRIGIISKGKLLFVGTVEQAREQFAKEGSLEKVFLEITENV